MQSETKVALVTGGSRGIGLGVALKLAEAGFTLVISGRRAHDQVQFALNQLRQHSAASIYVQADVASGADRARLLLAVEDNFGRLDVLVNNAGIAPRVRADILEAHSWMIRQQSTVAQVHRAIINISSISATVASVNRGDYCISKAGIAMATRLWAVRLAEYGIGVYEVRPGIIETDMTSGVRDKYDALIDAGLLLEKRWGTPADVGSAVCLLAKGELKYATGSVLQVDGGLTVPRL